MIVIGGWFFAISWLSMACWSSERNAQDLPGTLRPCSVDIIDARSPQRR
jgi:hypothetical protein